MFGHPNIKSMRVRSVSSFTLLLIAVVATLASTCPTTAESEAPPELLALERGQEKALKAISDEGDQRCERLKSEYVAALGEVENAMTSKGDLDAVLAVRAERERVRDGRETSDADKKAMPSSLLGYRKRYETNLRRILDEIRQKQTNVQKLYAKDLGPLQISLTQQGKIDAALVVKQERERILADLPSAAGQPSMAKGLVLWFGLNKDEGDAIADRSLSRLKGGIHGAKFYQGPGRPAYEFNGQSDYIAVPFDSSYEFRATGEFTLAAWVKPVLRPGLAQGIIVKAPPGWAFEWGLYVDQQSHFIAGWERNHVVQSKLAADPDQWSHVAATYNNGDWVLYINGAEEARAAHRRIAPTNGGLAIGRKGECATFTDFFQGRISEVRVYNRALPAEEIKALYRSQK